MSLLPQRKKSPEEIARLRESLGIHPLPEGGNEAPSATSLDTIVPTRHEATVVHHPSTPEPEAPPSPAPHEPKPVHSLKRSERPPTPPDEEAAEIASPPPAPVPHLPRPVRSLRKSEQTPILTAAEAPSESRIPVHRHSDKELNEIRRREALAMMTPVVNPKLAVAHPALLIPGYLLAVAGSACFFFYEFPMPATASCAAVALLIAAFVFLRRPISRHHAAFIAVIALLVLVFGALHYFPQLRHAT